MYQVSRDVIDDPDRHKVFQLLNLLPQFLWWPKQTWNLKRGNSEIALIKSGVKTRLSISG